MEYGFPSGIIGLLFIWGLWEWSKKRKQDKEIQDQNARSKNTQMESDSKLEQYYNQSNENEWEMKSEIFYRKVSDNITIQDEDIELSQESSNIPDGISRLLWVVIFIAVITLVILGVVVIDLIIS